MPGLKVMPDVALAAAEGYRTPTEEYAARLNRAGIPARAGQSLPQDMGIRAAGVLGDVADNVAFGLPGFAADALLPTRDERGYADGGKVRGLQARKKLAEGGAPEEGYLDKNSRRIRERYDKYSTSVEESLNEGNYANAAGQALRYVVTEPYRVLLQAGVRPVLSGLVNFGEGLVFGKRKQKPAQAAQAASTASAMSGVQPAPTQQEWRDVDGAPGVMRRGNSYTNVGVQRDNDAGAAQQAAQTSAAPIARGAIGGVDPNLVSQGTIGALSAARQAAAARGDWDAIDASFAPRDAAAARGIPVMPRMSEADERLRREALAALQQQAATPRRIGHAHGITAKQAARQQAAAQQLLAAAQQPQQQAQQAQQAQLAKELARVSQSSSRAASSGKSAPESAASAALIKMSGGSDADGIKHPDWLAHPNYGLAVGKVYEDANGNRSLLTRDGWIPVPTSTAPQ